MRVALPLIAFLHFCAAQNDCDASCAATAASETSGTVKATEGARFKLQEANTKAEAVKTQVKTCTDGLAAIADPGDTAALTAEIEKAKAAAGKVTELEKEIENLSQAAAKTTTAGDTKSKAVDAEIKNLNVQLNEVKPLVERAQAQVKALQEEINGLNSAQLPYVNVDAIVKDVTSFYESLMGSEEKK